MNRTLTLKSEALADLTVDELAGVGGGAEIRSGLSCPVRDCIENLPTFPPQCYSAPWC